MKVASYDIVFQEIPGEVTLALNLSGCPCHCPGCHSPHLADDIGEELNETLLDGLINRYGSMITCVAFMGGDADPAEVLRLAGYIKSLSAERSISASGLCSISPQDGLKVAWYSGRPALPPSLEERVGERFSYLKLGPYIESLGGLKSPTTNQRLYKRVGDDWQDMTSSFWKSNF